MKITQALINSCLIALSQASFEIMRVYAQDFEVTVKEDGSPVTIADRLSSQIITQHLIPYGYPVLSEEDQIPAYSIRKNWETFWPHHDQRY